MEVMKFEEPHYKVGTFQLSRCGRLPPPATVAVAVGAAVASPLAKSLYNDVKLSLTRSHIRMITTRLVITNST